MNPERHAYKFKSVMGAQTYQVNYREYALLDIFFIESN